MTYFVPDASNYCRNVAVNGDTVPWCYTTDPKKRTELCDICSCTVGLLISSSSKMIAFLALRMELLMLLCHMKCNQKRPKAFFVPHGRHVNSEGMSGKSEGSGVPGHCEQDQVGPHLSELGSADAARTLLVSGE